MSPILSRFTRQPRLGAPPSLEATDAAWRETAAEYDARLAERNERLAMANAYSERSSVRENPDDPYNRQLNERLSAANDAYLDARDAMDRAWHTRHRSWLAEGARKRREYTVQHRKENTAAFTAYTRAKHERAAAAHKARAELERRIDADRKSAA